MVTKNMDSKAPGKSGKRARSAVGDAQTCAAKIGTQSEADWHAQLAEDRIGKVDTDGPGSHPVGATSSANSVSADPFARKKALGEPVPQVTRHI